MSQILLEYFSNIFGYLRKEERVERVRKDIVR
jgi:hypothetical protein